MKMVTFEEEYWENGGLKRNIRKMVKFEEEYRETDKS